MTRHGDGSPGLPADTGGAPRLNPGERLGTPADERELERLRGKFPSAGGNGSRRKGADGELEVCAILRVSGWPDARRTADGRSQAGRGDIADGPAGVHWEVRRRERAEIWQWLADAEKGSGTGSFPVVAFRRSRSGWWAALPLDELLPLLRAREGAS
jgi:hypothetical protein